MKIHSLRIPEERVRPPSKAGALDVVNQELLESNGSAEAVASEPETTSFEIVFDDQFADRRAEELQQLATSKPLSPIVVSGVTPALDGYWVFETADREIEFDTPNDRQSIQIDATLAGTRSSHYRAVYTRLSQPDPGNIFGNDTTALVGVPSESTRVTWYDRSFADREPLSIVDTVSTADGDVDLYDARDVQDELGDDPVLVYRPPEVEGQTDVGVWDTYGSDDESEWARVYNVDHVPRVDDDLVIENGLVRLWLADGPAALAADEWDSSSEEWSEISLVDTDWELVDTDLTRIGAVAVEAQCIFSDGDEDFALDLRLERGRQAPQWLIPTNDPIPSRLEELLEPIADEAVYVTKASLGLVSRKKLRR